MKKALFLLIIFAGLFFSSCVSQKGLSERDPFAPESIRKQQLINRQNNKPNSSVNAHSPKRAYYRKASKEAMKDAHGPFVNQFKKTKNR